MRRKRSWVPWASFVWNNAIAPRYQFHLCLITKNHLPTQACLLSHGRIDYTCCAFCNDKPDSIDRLFFECHTSTTLAFFWATRCNIPWRNRSWMDNLLWLMKYLSENEFFHSLSRFSFGALCHIIWKKRNDDIFRGEAVVILALKNHLIKVVKDKALTYKNVPNSYKNRRLQRCWGFDTSILSLRRWVLAAATPSWSSFWRSGDCLFP